MASYLDEPDDIYWEAIRERDGIARSRASLAAFAALPAVVRQRERDARRAASRRPAVSKRASYGQCQQVSTLV